MKVLIAKVHRPTLDALCIDHRLRSCQEVLPSKIYTICFGTYPIARSVFDDDLLIDMCIGCMNQRIDLNTQVLA